MSNEGTYGDHLTLVAVDVSFIIKYWKCHQMEYSIQESFPMTENMIQHYAFLILDIFQKVKENIM